MDNLTQPSWPLSWETLPDGTVQLAEVEQDSDADRLSRAATVVAVPKGAIDFEPEIGVTPLIGKPAVNTDRLVAEINRNEPDLNVTAEEAIDAADHTHRIVTIHVTAGE